MVIAKKVSSLRAAAGVMGYKLYAVAYRKLNIG
jgi:hypothetical protein